MSAWTRNTQRSAGPSGPHRFVEPDDNRLGLALGATRPTLQMGPALAVTDASLTGVNLPAMTCAFAQLMRECLS